MLSFFVVYNFFYFVNDLQNLMFALNTWHYFKLQCRIGQSQHISCPTRSMGAGDAGAHAELLYRRTIMR